MTEKHETTEHENHEETLETVEPETVEPEENSAESTPDDEQHDDKTNPSREAAKYRKQLRETEAERDTLREQLENLQRAEVERHAAHLTQPAAIWKAGLELADLKDDNGNLDPEKITTAISSAADSLGLAERRRPPRPHPAQHGGDAAPGARGDNMADVISGKRTY